MLNQRKTRKRIGKDQEKTEKRLGKDQEKLRKRLAKEQEMTRERLGKDQEKNQEKTKKRLGKDQEKTRKRLGGTEDLGSIGSTRNPGSQVLEVLKSLVFKFCAPSESCYQINVCNLNLSFQIQRISWSVCPKLIYPFSFPYVVFCSGSGIISICFVSYKLHLKYLIQSLIVIVTYSGGKQHLQQ